MILLPVLGLATAALQAQAFPAQEPFEIQTAQDSIQAAVPRGDIIDAWALNPSGDAAVIRVESQVSGSTAYDLHLLAINAQFTVPSAEYGPTDSRARYTFISDDTFVTLSPLIATSDEDVIGDSHPRANWELYSQKLNYTTLPPAWLPSASEPNRFSTLKFDGEVEELVYASDAGILTIVLAPSTESTSKGSRLILLEVSQDGHGNVEVSKQNVVDEGIIAKEVITNGTHLAYTGYNGSSSSDENSYDLFVLDLQHNQPAARINDPSLGSVSGIAFGTDGQLAWLASQSKGKRLWLREGGETFSVQLKGSNPNPSKVIFSKDGEAIYLLAPHEDQQSLFHLWTPTSSSSSIEPIRIPSNGTIHSAIHVGITPLDHAHLIGVKSDGRRGEGKELWVISHSPHEDPTYNYENIRLTFFSDSGVQAV